MATARTRGTGRDATLRGIGNSLYTPFCGKDGDDIDWDAYRTLVRYCVGELGHPMLWCTSGIAEFWSLTLDERKHLLEVAIEEGAQGEPRCRRAGLHGGDVGQGLPGPDAARPAGRRRHRLHPDADDGGPRRRGRAELLPLHRRSHRHRIGHVQLAVVGLRVDARGECAHLLPRSRPSARRRRARSGPRAAGCCTSSRPSLAIWECDLTVYRAGWLRAGIVGPAQLGTAGYLYETPQQPVISEYWELVWNDKLIEAMDYAEKSGWTSSVSTWGSWFTCYPGPARLLHALGRRIQVRGVGARPADRRLPALAAAAGRVARRGQDADSSGVSAVRTGRRS